MADDEGGICQNESWLLRLWLTNGIGKFGAHHSPPPRSGGDLTTVSR